MSCLSSIALSVLSGCFLAGCAGQQVGQKLAKQSDFEGKVYADEVMAQSPFEKVELTWQEAYELMKTRNPKYRAAMRDFSDATMGSSLVSDFRTQLGSSLGDTVRGVIDPGQMLKTLKDPVTSLPEQLESISSLKDVNHDMEQKAWGKKEKAVKAELKRRTEVVRLQILFRRGEILKKHKAWTEKMQAKEKLAPGAKGELAKYVGKLKKDRKKWLDQMRDFFDAEYYDVEVAGGDGKLPDYHAVSRPDFSDWKRWGSMKRKTAVVGVMKKSHDEGKPLIPGSDALASRLDMMFSGEEHPAVQLEREKVRESTRLMIRSWREMKKAQTQADTIKNDLEKVMASESPGKAAVAKKQQLYAVQNSELASARVVWMLDESCWKD